MRLCRLAAGVEGAENNVWGLAGDTAKVADTENLNFSYNAKDEALARKINALVTEPIVTDEVEERWAELDHEIQKTAGVTTGRSPSTIGRASA